MQVTKHKVAVIDYTLTDNDGNVLDECKDGQFAYVHGTQSIIPGLETALEGTAAGESLNVTVQPKDAYGERHLEAIQRVPRNMFPADVELQPGMQFQAQAENGQPMILHVTAVDGEDVVVDGNHPFAGIELNFDVTVVDVRDATEEELSHGHAHHGDTAHD